MSTATLELAQAAATLGCAALGYLLAEIRRKRELREAHERRQHPTLVTVTLTDEIRNAIKPEVRDAAAQYFGGFRREMSDAMAKFEVELKSALGDLKGERESGIAERKVISERLTALYRATEALLKATSELGKLWT